MATPATDDTEQKTAMFAALLTKTPEELLRAYFLLTDRLDEEEKVWKERKKEIEERITRISSALQEQMKQWNVTSINTPAGSVSTRSSFHANIDDFPAFSEWAQANGRIAMFQSKVVSSVIKQYLDENGTLPPGISKFEKVVPIISKPRAKKP